MKDISILDIVKREHERMKAIGSRLKQIREKEGKSIAEFASLLEVDEDVISKIESGAEFPTLEILFGLKAQFNTNNNWLITGKAKPSIKKKCLMVDKKYAELFNLMRLPQIEKIILGKLFELKLICKDEISNPIGSDLKIKRAGR